MVVPVLASSSSSTRARLRSAEELRADMMVRIGKEDEDVEYKMNEEDINVCSQQHARRGVDRWSRDQSWTARHFSSTFVNPRDAVWYSRPCHRHIGLA
jgi:hypothetical protein